MIKFIGFSIIFLVCLVIFGLREHRRNKKQFGLPDHIKDHYAELKVPAKEIEVLTNKYEEEVEISASVRIKAADALYDNSRNFTKELKYASVLVYYHSFMGKTIRLHSETIDMSNSELKSVIRSHGVISIYYDKKNINNHYFDLSFLT
jgi:hypothetical protein